MMQIDQFEVKQIKNQGQYHGGQQLDFSFLKNQIREMKLQTYISKSERNMSQNNHLNEAYIQNNDGLDFNYGIQDLNDQEISDTTPRFKLENFRNFNYSDSDSERGQFINVGSQESSQEKNVVQEVYLDKLEKGLDQYCQSKKNSEKPLSKHQQPTVFSENQLDERKTKKIKKVWKQRTRGRKLLRGTVNKIKIEEDAEKSEVVEKITINNQAMEEELWMHPEQNRSNLKNISRKVCQYMQSFEFISNSELFERLRDQVSENKERNKKQQDRYLKNLKRRMYDVVNVLRSSNIIFPQMQDRRKFIFQKNTQFKLDQVESEYHAKLKQLQQKKKKLEMLRTKRSDLQRLIARNNKYEGKIQQSQKVYFPLFFYKPMQNQQCELNPNQIRIRKSMTRRRRQNKIFGFCDRYHFDSQLDSLSRLKKLKFQTKPQPPMKIEIHKKEIPWLIWTQFSNIEKIKRGQQSKYD